MELESTLEKLRETGLSDSDINHEIEKKQKEYCDLITNTDALYLVAHDHGLKIEKTRQKQNTLLVNAKYGRKLTFIARLQQASCPKKFKTVKNSGIVLNLTVSDETKQANIVLWNKDVQNFLELKALKNDLLIMENFIVKSETPLEIHSTLSSEINNAPTKTARVYERKIPKLAINLTKLKDVQTNTAEIDTTGIVSAITPAREFEKNNGSETRKIKVMRVMLANDDKIMPLVIWNDLCEYTSKVKKGDELYLENCIVKPNSYTQQIEIHTTRNTNLVIKNTKKENALLLKIGEIKENDACILKCEVEKLLEVKTLNLCAKCRKTVKSNCKCGGQTRQVLVAATQLKDETGEMTCTFFEKTAMQLLNIQEYNMETLDAVYEFKTQELKNKKLYLKVTAKQNEFLGKTTLTCKEIMQDEETIARL